MLHNDFHTKWIIKRVSQKHFNTILEVIDNVRIDTRNAKTVSGWQYFKSSLLLPSNRLNLKNPLYQPFYLFILSVLWIWSEFNLDCELNPNTVWVYVYFFVLSLSVSGEHCEFDRRAGRCGEGICHNGGTCRELSGGGFRCDCPAGGYEKPYCSVTTRSFPPKSFIMFRGLRQRFHFSVSLSWVTQMHKDTPVHKRTRFTFKYYEIFNYYKSSFALCDMFNTCSCSLIHVLLIRKAP